MLALTLEQSCIVQTMRNSKVLTTPRVCLREEKIGRAGCDVSRKGGNANSQNDEEQ